MNRPFRTYLVTWLGASALALLLMAAVNVVVDPLYAFGGSLLRGLDPYRGLVASRVFKAEVLRHADYQVLLLGSSRVEVGFDVNSPVWGELRVLNLGLPGTNLWETQHALELALRDNPPETVILFTDFLMFNSMRTGSYDFYESRMNPKLSGWKYIAAILTSYRSSRGSARVLYRATRHRRQPPILTTARKDALPPPRFSMAANFRKRSKTFIRRFSEDPELYAGQYSDERVRILEKMVDSAVRADIRVIVAIPAIHALQLESMIGMDQWDSFEQWKRDMVSVLSTRGIPLWDFTGYDEYTTEPAPLDGDDGGLKWWVDSSHFRPPLGDLIVKRIFGVESQRFGVLLTPQNIEGHLRRLRADRDAWEQANPRAVEWVRKLQQQARADRLTYVTPTRPIDDKASVWAR